MLIASGTKTQLNLHIINILLAIMWKWILERNFNVFSKNIYNTTNKTKQNKIIDIKNKIKWSEVHTRHTTNETRFLWKWYYHNVIFNIRRRIIKIQYNKMENLFIIFAKSHSIHTYTDWSIQYIHYVGGFLLLCGSSIKWMRNCKNPLIWDVKHMQLAPDTCSKSHNIYAFNCPT